MPVDGTGFTGPVGGAFVGDDGGDVVVGDDGGAEQAPARARARRVATTPRIGPL
jgi:hypothetical protein